MLSLRAAPSGGPSIRALPPLCKPSKGSSREAPVNQRLHAASILFNFYNWSTRGNTAAQLVARSTPWLRDPHVTPHNQVSCRMHLAFNQQIGGDHADARRIMEETKESAVEFNLKSVLFEIYHSEAIRESLLVS